MAAKKRHPRHDELVANIVGQRSVLESYVRQICDEHCGINSVTIEWEVLEKHYERRRVVNRREGWADIAVLASAEQTTFCLLIEVKSELEKWTAGDVIRQLKRYAQALEASTYERVAHQVKLGFFCDRVLTEAEAALFTHEDVHVLK